MEEFGIIFILVLIVILLYLIGGGLLEHYHVHVLHETGLGILLGMTVGFAIYSINYEFYHEHMLFKGELFFYLILPPIIFSGGYNLKKRRFFQNFYYVNVYGMAGTIVNFIVVWLLTYAINDAGLIRRFSDFDTSINLSNREILLFSATICATDSVSALAMIKPDQSPKLFSVIFGEGMINDSVSIILYKAVLDLVGEEEEPKEIKFTFVTLLQMIGQFLKNAVSSLSIGIFYGLVASLITKRLRFLNHNPIVETVIVLVLGFCSFATAEIFEFSGVIAILVTGIVMSHYTFYNISSTGKVTTGVTFGSISAITEAVLYIYLGIIVWQTKGNQEEANSFAWSWTFLLLELLVIFFARTMSVFVLSWVFILFKGRKNWRLNRYEMGIVWFSGIIRGAVAFALIQNVPGESDSAQIEIIQSTTLFIVIITTVVLGGMMPKYIRYMQQQIQGNTERYSPEHPSMEKVLLNKGEKQRSTGYKKWLWFDETIAKTFLIFDYENRREEIHRDRQNLKINSQHFSAERCLRFNKDADIEKATLQKKKGEPEEEEMTIQTFQLSPTIFKQKTQRSKTTESDETRTQIGLSPQKQLSNE